MFTDVTWQDYEQADNKTDLILDAIARYKCSRDFLHALEANAYFRGENPAVSRKTVLQPRKLVTRDEAGRRRSRASSKDVVGNRIGSAFLRRFVVQQNQFLLGNGCILPNEEMKKRLGCDFDHQLAALGERALLHGVSYLYWNCDHAEVLEAAVNPLSGFFPLWDEITGDIRVGVQFWQVSLHRPLHFRLFEENGVSLWRMGDQGLQCIQKKQPYLTVYRSDLLGDTALPAESYNRLPIIPLYANAERQSELTPAIQAKIDAYDRILSDFADNLDRANDVYWVLNNFGGTSEDVAELLEEINRVKAVATLSDGSGSNATAEPRTIEVPYAARQAALTLLEKALYRDYMALDMDELTGGSLTNVAIRAATANLNLKADRFEWEVFRCVRSLLGLLNMDTDEIRFQRQEIGNESETVADIAVMRGDIDRRTALKLNPYIQPDEIEGLLSQEETKESAD